MFLLSFSLFFCLFFCSFCLSFLLFFFFFFFFQAEDGIRDRDVTGVQTCALPIWDGFHLFLPQRLPSLWQLERRQYSAARGFTRELRERVRDYYSSNDVIKIGRASCRERV